MHDVLVDDWAEVMMSCLFSQSEVLEYSLCWIWRKTEFKMNEDWIQIKLLPITYLPRAGYGVGHSTHVTLITDYFFVHLEEERLME